MISGLDYFRELNIASVLLRLVLAMAFGGMIGLERGRKHRAAGFRTYMLVCLGSALTSILSQYLFVQLSTVWAEIAVTTGKQVDVSRLGAKVYSGRRYDHRHWQAGGQGNDDCRGTLGICLHGHRHRRGVL